MIALQVAVILFLSGSSLQSSLTGYILNLNTKNCPGKLVLGLDRLAHGVDLTKLDLYHDYAANSQDGFTQRVFNWHCSERVKWTSSYDGVDYLQPDEIDSVEDLPSGRVVVSDTAVIRDASDVRKSMAEQVGLETTLATAEAALVDTLTETSVASELAGCFSDSTTYQKTLQTLRDGNTMVTQSRANVNLYKVTTKQAFQLAQNWSNLLSDAFTHHVDYELPASLTDETVADYCKFFETFGTHYFAQADFGGSLSSWFTIKTSHFRDTSSESVESNVKTAFKKILQDHDMQDERDGNDDQVDSTFSGAISHSESYYGGETNLLEKNGSKTWWPTVAAKPFLQSGQLKPLTDLLPDNHPKKRHLIDAYQSYRTKAYIDEVMRSVEAALKKPESLDNILLRKLKTKLMDASAMPFPPLDRVQQWQKELIDFTVMPDWFKYEVRVCFEFRDYGEVCSRLGVAPRGMNFINPPLKHSPCDGTYYHPDCAQTGRMYFKAPATHQATLDGYGGRFELKALNVYYDSNDYVQRYGAKFVVNTSSESSVAPAWLRRVRACSHKNTVTEETNQCASGPNEIIPANSVLFHNPSYYNSHVPHGNAFSFYATY